MGMFSRLFKRQDSSTPEDYGPIYVKWERDGKEYGPYQFEDLAEGRWSGPPEIGRFAGERRWRNYDEILKVLRTLRASQEQLTFLREGQIEFIESDLSFLEARRLIDGHREKVRASNAAERREKDKLPATKQYRKKMDGLGISYPDDVTRCLYQIFHPDRFYGRDTGPCASGLRFAGVIPWF